MRLLQLLWFYASGPAPVVTLRRVTFVREQITVPTFSNEEIA